MVKFPPNIRAGYVTLLALLLLFAMPGIAGAQCTDAPPPPTISAGGPTSFCPSGSVTLSPVTAQATDLSYPTSSIGTHGNTQWQTFIPTISGYTTGLKLKINGQQTGTYTLKIYNGPGNGGALLYTTSFSLSSFGSGWWTVPIPLSAHLSLTPGNSYTFETSGADLNLSASYSIPGSYYSSAYGLNPGWKLCFETLVTPASGPNYQWQRNGTDIAGATSSSYTATLAGNYTLKNVSTGGCPSTASNTIATTVLQTPPTPTIAAGGSTTFCAPGSVLLNATTTAVTDLSFSQVSTGTYGTTQWQSFVPTKDGYTTALKLLVNGAQTGNYTLKFYSGIGTAGTLLYTTTFALSNFGSGWWTVPIPASDQLNLAPGSNYTFEITGSNLGLAANSSGYGSYYSNVYGSPYWRIDFQTEVTPVSGPSYQWQLDGGNIAGATASSYLAAVSGSYTLKNKSTDGCLSAASNAIAVTSNNPVSITMHPAGQNLCAGQALNLSVTASNAAGYQWYRNGNLISGATNATYSLTSATTAEGGSYSVVVSGNTPCGSVTSNAATVTVNGAVAITTQPASQSLCAGQPLSLSVVAGNASSYQWQKDGVNISGATSSSYAITSTTVSDAGSYSVIVSGNAPCGSVTSTTAAVTVNSQPAFSACPGNQTVNQCAASTVTYTATADAPISYVFSGATTGSGTGTGSGATFNTGVTTVILIADNGSCQATCTFTVTVSDTEAPAIQACNPAITLPPGACACYPMLASVPSPVTLNWAGRLQTYTNVSINGGGNAAQVVPGSSVSLSYNMSVYVDQNAYCPGCIVQSYIGIGGSNTTINCEPSIGNGFSASRNVSFTAPTTPGYYYLTQNGSLQYNCVPSGFNNAANNAIGVIQVGASYAGLDVVSSDNCGIASITNNAPACFPAGTTLVTYTVTDNAGNVTTCTQSVTSDGTTTPPVFTTNPQSTFVCEGGSLTLTASVPGALSYEWYHDNVLVPGATNGNLLLSNVSSADAGSYYAKTITNCGASTSATALVTVNPIPVVSIAASNTTICPGSNASTTLTASGADTYVWSAGGSTNNPETFSPTANTTYTVTGTSTATGCSATASIAINVGPAITLAPTATPAIICLGSTSQLDAGSGQAGPPVSGTIGSYSYGDYYGGPFRQGACINYKVQYIYTAAELQAAGISAGPITSIAFDAVDEGYGGEMGNYTISMKNTTMADYSSGMYETGLTTVFGPVGYTSVNGLNTFAFNTPYTWDGASNLAIQICHDNTCTGSASVKMSGTAGALTLENSFGNGCGEYYGSGLYNRPVLTLQGSGSIPLTYSWTPAATLDDASIATPTGTPAASTTYDVTATDATSGCAATGSVTVTVENPSVSLTPAAQTMACGSGTVAINISTSNASNPALTWNTLQGLYTDAAATVPYAGGPASVVYAQLSSDLEYSVTVSSNGCTGTGTAAVADVEVNGGTNGIATATSTSTQVYSQLNTVDIRNQNCELMASVTPGGTNQISGTVNASLDVMGAAQLNAYGEPFVGRVTMIEPQQDAANATANVTLYVTQAEFSAYNAILPATANPAVWSLAPASSTDNAGADNVRVTQVHGTDPNGLHELIDPAVSWNSSLNAWEITFPVNGFSTFYVHTDNATHTPLPVVLVDVLAANEGSRNRVEWQSASEDHLATYIVEKSNDGKLFTQMAEVSAKGKAAGYITYDNAPNNGLTYYRLKMVDQDGTIAYSKTVSAFMNGRGAFALQAAPNPTTGLLTITALGGNSSTAKVQITDVAGHVIAEVAMTDGRGSVDLSSVAAGVYFVKYADGQHSQTIKVTKQ